jgi:DNA replication protein DnaC
MAGAQGLGKTMIARNLGHYAVMQGYTCLFTTASALAMDLGAQDSKLAMQRRIKHHALEDFLIIDEIGYLSFYTGKKGLLKSADVLRVVAKK